MLACALACLASVARAEPPADLGLAQELLQTGRAEKAWELLAPQEEVQAGDEDFDYLLGLAALESGRIALATLHFERVLASNPNHAAARLDLGRAYHLLGDFNRARRELETALILNPPPAARTTIETHLARIETATRPRIAVSGYLEGTIGRDSNVNAATTQSAVFMPLLNASVNLPADAIGRSAPYQSVSGGAEIRHRIDDQFSVLANVDGKSRRNDGISSLDIDSIDVRGAIQYSDNSAHTVRLGMGRGELGLGGNDYRHTESINLEWRRALDQTSQATLFAQRLRMTYVPVAVVSEDAQLDLAGLAWLRRFGPGDATTLAAAVMAGHEQDLRARLDGARNLTSIRLGLFHQLRADLLAFGSLSMQSDRYERQNLLFQTYRRDSVADLSLGLEWRVAPDWILRPQFQTMRSDSNIVAHNYRRRDIAVTLRRNFQ